MLKRLLSLFIVFFVAVPAYADTATDLYLTTVNNAILKRSNKEAIEDSILQFFISDSDYTITLENTDQLKSVFSDIKIDTITDSINKDTFLQNISLKIKELYQQYSTMENSSLKYTAILYVINFTNKIAPTYSNFETDLGDIYKQIKDTNSAINKAKNELENQQVTNLIYSETMNENKNATVSFSSANSLSEIFLQKNDKAFYLTNELLIGQALSATYVPLRTNISDEKLATESFKEFDFKYGGLRKALYINTSENAISQYYVTGKYSSFKIATLRDLLEDVDKDKLLVLDPSYYNKSKFNNINFKEEEERIPIALKLIPTTTVYADTQWLQEVGKEKELYKLEGFLPSTKKENAKKLLQDETASDINYRIYSAALYALDGYEIDVNEKLDFTNFINELKPTYAEVFFASCHALKSPKQIVDGLVKSNLSFGDKKRYFTTLATNIIKNSLPTIPEIVRWAITVSDLKVNFQAKDILDAGYLSKDNLLTKLGFVETKIDNILNSLSNLTKKKDKVNDPILLETETIETIDSEKDANADYKFSLFNNLKTFFPQWRDDNFPYNLNKMQQVLLVGSKAFNDIINQEVLSSIKDVNAPISPWTGITFMLEMYKDNDLAKIVSGNINKPIFRASTSEYGVDAKYNNLLLKNLENSYSIRYDVSLDLDSPIFIDIYGNILSESGIVIIPFAANATLQSQPYLLNMAMLSSYGRNKKLLDIDLSTNNLGYYISTLEGQDIILPDGNLNPVTISTEQGLLDISRINTTSADTKNILYNILYSNLLSENSNILTNIYISNILFQTLRGTTQDNINYNEEKLNSSVSFDKGTLSQALKYERLVNNLKDIGQNSILTVPDLSTLPGVEYIIFFAYKFFIILFIVYLLFQIYLAAIKQTIGIGTFFKVIISFFLISATAISLPLIFRYSYYYVNREFLQKEALIIAMLNEEKKNNGVELGIIDAKNPDISSQLTIKVTDVEVNFFQLLLDIVYVPDVTTMTDLYQKNMNYSLESDVNDYYLKGNSLYYSLSDLFDTSEVYTDLSTGQLKQIVKGSPAISFRLPYYAILDYLIHQTNSFNQLIASYSYDTQIFGDGRIRSTGSVERYLNSNAFNLYRTDILNGNVPENSDTSILSFALNDRSGVKAIYGMDSRSIYPSGTDFTNSKWFIEDLDEETLEEVSDNLDKDAIQWVYNNKHLIGRITDETLLKSLALYLSLKYNKYLGIQGPNYIEIDSISTDDLIRLGISDISKVMETYPYDYPKFILLMTDLPGIYAGAILTMIMFILSIVKPLVTMIVFIIMIASLIILRILFHKSYDSIKGLFKSCLFLTVINVSYCFILKLFIMLPSGIPSLIRIFLLILVHSLYTYAYIWLGSTLILNWKDLGNNAFNKLMHVKVESEDTDKGIGWELYEKLKASDKYRKGGR